ncbi:MAG: S-adenosylmethionine decarboxylase [Azonexus sp.]|nr:S-adenosylmethionine decarboxylase [Azonexus sp.]
MNLIADLHDCRCVPGFLLDAPGLESFCVDACQRHGLTVVGRLFHAFRDASGQPAGVTGTVVLADPTSPCIPRRAYLAGDCQRDARCLRL